MSKERAASLAKNLTVNFNRRGRQTAKLGAYYAFLNAAIQGSTRMVETLRGPGQKDHAGRGDDRRSQHADCNDDDGRWRQRQLGKIPDL